MLLTEYLRTLQEHYLPRPEEEDRVRQKLGVFWRFTESLARLSYCQRLSVGCTLVPPDLSEVLAIGYNGPPSGVPNHSCRAAAGACGCVHAEANTIIKVRGRVSGLVMLTTHSPCEHCAGLIINSGSLVQAVVYGQAYRDPAGLDLLTRRGIQAIRVQSALPQE